MGKTHCTELPNSTAQVIRLTAIATGRSFPAVMSGLLAWRHKENIQRLLQGKESRLGSKKKA